MSSAELYSEEEVFFSVRCERVCRETIESGRLVVTSKALYFDPDPEQSRLQIYLTERGECIRVVVPISLFHRWSGTDETE